METLLAGGSARAGGERVSGIKENPKCEPSAWELRWIRWAKKEAKKHEKDKPAQETGNRR